jgi:hypothetical protein
MESLVAGEEYYGNGTGGTFFGARFTPTGELDLNYGVDGFGLSGEDNLQVTGGLNVGIALQDNGKVVVCGWTDTIAPTGGHVSDFAVACFLGDDGNSELTLYSSIAVTGNGAPAGTDIFNLGRVTKRKG